MSREAHRKRVDALRQRGDGKRAKRTTEFSLEIAGHGVAVRPKPAVGVAHLPNGALIFGPSADSYAKAKPARLQNVLLSPGAPPRGALAKRPVPSSPILAYSTGQPGTTQLLLGVDMTSYDALLHELRLAPRVGPWTIVTPDYEITWPVGYALMPTEGRDPRSPPYQLARDGVKDHAIALHGPLFGRDEIPSADEVFEPGVTRSSAGEIKASGALWNEGLYNRDGAPWRQRAYYVPCGPAAVYLLRVQGPASISTELFDAADAVVASFRARAR